MCNRLLETHMPSINSKSLPIASDSVIEKANQKLWVYSAKPFALLKPHSTPAQPDASLKSQTHIGRPIWGTVCSRRSNKINFQFKKFQSRQHEYTPSNYLICCKKLRTEVLHPHWDILRKLPLFRAASPKKKKTIHKPMFYSVWDCMHMEVPTARVVFLGISDPICQCLNIYLFSPFHLKIFLSTQLHRVYHVTLLTNNPTWHYQLIYSSRN